MGSSDWGLYSESSGASSASIFSPLLFDLDSQENNRAQFLYVATGFIATSLFLFVFVFFSFRFVCWQTGNVYRIGLAALTVFIEFPIAWFVYRDLNP